MIKAYSSVTHNRKETWMRLQNNLLPFMVSLSYSDDLAVVSRKNSISYLAIHIDGMLRETPLSTTDWIDATILLWLRTLK